MAYSEYLNFIYCCVTYVLRRKILIERGESLLFIHSESEHAHYVKPVRLSAFFGAKWDSLFTHELMLIIENSAV